MSTLQIAINCKLTNEKLDVSALTVVTTGTDVDLRAHQAIHVGRQGHALEVSLPEEDDVRITLLGFTDSSIPYSMTASSVYEDQTSVSWSTSSDDVVSPDFDDEGDYIISATATPSSGPAKTSTFSVKFRKPGKDDDFPE